MNLKKQERTNKQPASLRIQVYQNIKERILNGQLAMGTVVTQRDVANQLGVSRTPVRDAFLQLEQEGLVKTLHGRLVEVAQAPIEDIKRTFEIRAVLEGYAARQAASRIDHNTLAILHEIIEKQKTIVNCPTVSEVEGKEFFQLDFQFHKIIVNNSDNPRLVSILNGLIALTEFQIIQSRAVKVHQRLHKSVSEHENIVSLFESANSLEAEKALIIHLEGFCNDIIRFLMQ